MVLLRHRRKATEDKERRKLKATPNMSCCLYQETCAHQLGPSVLAPLGHLSTRPFLKGEFENANHQRAGIS